MGDHFVLLVDRLLTESTLEAVIESRNHSYQVEKAIIDPSQQILTEVTPVQSKCIDGTSARKLVQCRICHDEDEDCSMESPCSCCGSLKYAHRKCVQRWCNEKGDTICEICLQEFKPGYTTPPQLLHYSGMPMNFRGNWEISREVNNLRNPRVFAESRYDEDYEDSTARSVLYCRLVAVIVSLLSLVLVHLAIAIRFYLASLSMWWCVSFHSLLQFVVLLALRHTLPILIGGEERYSFAAFSIMLLRIAGVLVPVYVMARALSVFHHHRRRQQTRELPVAEVSSSDEDETRFSPQIQTRPHSIHIQ